jgi:hypothetical protein
MEKDALEQRYQMASQSIDPSVAPMLRHFETAVANQSEAVIARYATEVFRLAASDKELYASFYDLVQAGVRLSSEGFWDQVREAVDAKLFTHYKEHIRFAALSLDRRGLSHYGDCFLILKEDMIGHRATVFEENSVVFMHRRQIPVTSELPAGYRALWEDRGRLAAVKQAAELDPRTAEADFPSLLMSDGATAEDDRFVEVHIYGSMSIHAVAEVSFQSRGSAVRRKALREKLAKFGIPLKEH